MGLLLPPEQLSFHEKSEQQHQKKKVAQGRITADEEKENKWFMRTWEKFKDAQK